MKFDDETFRVTDDSGFLALVDPENYSSFVDPDWDFIDDLLPHFLQEMSKFHLLIWSTDMESIWKVRVHVGEVDANGYRETVGYIASGGRLLVTNYESLTMAAQFDDVKLPERHQAHLEFSVEPGIYRCRIVQIHSHKYGERTGMDTAEQHYVLELIKTDEKPLPWEAIAFFKM